jgi:CubicO group peptidase (beta-lactamase class C family)
MTKSFTASAVLLLRDRGALRLDDALVDHLPWARGLAAADGAPPSVGDLLTMTAGFPTDDPWGDRLESLSLPDFDALTAAGFAFARAPRTGFEYSNLGYALLGRVVEQVSGTAYRELVRTDLLEPLGMTSTVFDVEDVDPARLVPGHAPRGDGLAVEPVVRPGAFSAMGGLHSSVSDIAVWVAAFERAWHGGTAHPLGRGTAREMQDPRSHVSTTLTTPDDGSVATTLTTSYGYGLFVADDSALGRFVLHSGGYPGYGSHMRWHPATGWGVIALANRTYAPAGRACDAVLRAAVAATYAESPPDPLVELWPRTRDAMAVVESLASSWDDDLAAAWLAPNVALDRAWSERREALEAVRRELGALERADRAAESSSPAHARWWLRGEHGHAVAEVLLSPDLVPLVQSFRVEVEPPA